MINQQPDITQSHIARQAGVSRQAVHQWQKGKTMPSMKTLKQLKENAPQIYETIISNIFTS